jgi:DNA-binding CsgD family transcriptional regulator
MDARKPSVPAGTQRAAKVVPVPTLHVSIGPLAGRVVRIEQPSGTVGRLSENDYVLNDPGVSRLHARLERLGTAVILTNLSTTSGTKVNGEAVDGPRSLLHGDEVAFGPVVARFEDPAAAAQREDSTVVFDVPQVFDAGPHLSPRQQEVLELMARGLTNNEIGEELGVTERTVKAYAQELYDKLGVRNRAGAVAEAAKLGLL